MNETVVSVDEKLCSHLDSVVPEVLKQALTSPKIVCKRCLELPPKNRAPSENAWICLTCGHCGCGREQSGGLGHAFAHFSQNPQHSISINSTTSEIWCYSCDETLVADSNKSTLKSISDCEQLMQSFIHNSLYPSSQKPSEKPTNTQHSSSSSTQQQQRGKKGKKKGGNQHNQGISQKAQTAIAAHNIEGFRGLANLGNTCFCNSVLQNLSHTVPFVSALIGTKAGDGNWISNQRKIAPGSMTSGMISVLNAIHKMTNTHSAFSPNELFLAVCKKVPRFKSYQQQDAHELLVTILDGISREQKSISSQKQQKKPEPTKEISQDEPKDGQTEEKTSLKEEEKDDQETKGDDSTDEKKEETKEKKGHETLIEEIFGGESVSAVTCHLCGEVSITKEQFLSISLPIPGKQEAEFGFQQLTSSPKKAKHDEIIAAMIHRPAPRMSKNKMKKLRAKGIMVTQYKQSEEKKKEESKKEEEKEESETEMVVNEELQQQQQQQQTNIVFEAKDFRGTPPQKPESSAGRLSLQDCLAAYTSPEKLTGDNKYRCANCTAKALEKIKQKQQEEQQKQDGNEEKPKEKDKEGEKEEGEEKATTKGKGAKKKKVQKPKQETFGVLTEATKQIVIRSLPQILIIQIKRFSMSGHGNFSKLSDNIVIPMALNMKPYCESSSSNDNNHCFYGLYGVAEHAGSLGGGHYTATVSWGNEWCHISDSSVSKSDASRAVNSSAYLLFYEKRFPKIPEPIVPLIEEEHSETKEETNQHEQPTTEVKTQEI